MSVPNLMKRIILRFCLRMLETFRMDDVIADSISISIYGFRLPPARRNFWLIIILCEHLTTRFVLLHLMLEVPFNPSPSKFTYKNSYTHTIFDRKIINRTQGKHPIARTCKSGKKNPYGLYEHTHSYDSRHSFDIISPGCKACSAA